MLTSSCHQARASRLECVTWGKVQRLTWNFFKRYFDEAWVVLTPDQVDPKSGKDVAGFDSYTLGQDFAALTGRQNPIPAPQPPTPVPTPTPTPVPVPVPAQPSGQDVANDIRSLLTQLGL